MIISKLHHKRASHVSSRPSLGSIAPPIEHVTKTKDLIQAITKCTHPRQLSLLIEAHATLIDNAITEAKTWGIFSRRNPGICILKTAYKGCSIMAAIYIKLESLSKNPFTDNNQLYRCWKRARPFFTQEAPPRLTPQIKALLASCELNASFLTPNPGSLLTLPSPIEEDSELTPLYELLAPYPRTELSIFDHAHFNAIFIRLQEIHINALTNKLVDMEKTRHHQFVRCLITLTDKKVINGDAIILSSGEPKTFRGYLLELLEEIGIPSKKITPPIERDEFCTSFGKRQFTTPPAPIQYTSTWTNDAGLIDLSFPGIGLAVVTDGIDVSDPSPTNDASGIAAILFQTELSKHYKDMVPQGFLDPDEPENHEDISAILQAIANNINKVVVDKGLGSTTLCATLRIRHHCFILNCGDSETRIIHKDTVHRFHLDMPRCLETDRIRSEQLHGFFVRRGYQPGDHHYPLITSDAIPLLPPPNLSYADTGQGTLGIRYRAPAHVIYHKVDPQDQVFIMSDGIEVFPNEIINPLLKAECLPEAIFVQSTLFSSHAGIPIFGKSWDDFTLMTLPDQTTSPKIRPQVYGSALRYTQTLLFEDCLEYLDSRHNLV